jgi:3-oxoacyl-[acyl-carrier protein] reductase
MPSEKTAIVTGASAGIGAAIARSLIEDGYRVVSLDRAAANWQHERLISTRIDLTDEGALQEVADEVASRFSPSCLVHNAGVIRPNLLEQATTDDLVQLARLHLATPLVLVKPLLPSMKAARSGRVVMISSRAALGVVTRTAYSATKAGIIGMARTWALELGPFGITVNVVAPGPIGSTNMFEELVPPGSDQESMVKNSIPLRRLGTPDDVAGAVGFLVSEKASFVTGQVLYVCGGASVGLSPL